MFTAQQNIANRGSDENRKKIHEKSDSNRGTFLELLHLRTRDIPWLKNMLIKQLKKGIQWTSPMIQKELLSLLTQQTLQRILQDVKNEPIYTLSISQTITFNLHYIFLLEQ